MKTKSAISLFFISCLLTAGCASPQQVVREAPQQVVKEAPEVKMEELKAREPAVAPATVPAKNIKAGPAPKSQLMVDYQIKPIDIEMKSGRPYLPVGAEFFTRDGKVPLQKVMKELANLKGLSVSWADDVDFGEFVDVDIRPEDNFWDALDNILRQLDYFYELDKDTIIIKYKETREYQLAMPFLKENFETSVGGNLLGGSASEGKMSGEMKMEGSFTEALDVWKIIEDNLTTIIQRSAPQRKVEEAEGKEKAKGKASSQASESARGYFITDHPLGIITVTAPRKTQERVKNYLDTLREELYKQVIIEAKIIEVILNDSSQLGIDWNKVLNTTLSGIISFGKAGVIYPFSHADGFIKQVKLSDHSFELMLKALAEYGQTNILSNPKISILNGHGATMTVGENVTYIDKVTTTTDAETRTVTYSVTTDSILSGVGLAIIANVINRDEVILYVVPITSELQEPITYEEFGGEEGARIGLPRVKLKEMATFAKITSSQTLIIGGLIDEKKTNEESKVPILGDLPLINRLFKWTNKSVYKRELVILLKPRILDWGSGS